MTKIQSSVPGVGEGTEWLIESARQQVLNLWNEHRDKRLVYHNFAQTAEVARLVAEIGTNAGLPAEVIDTALLAAWFHNAGYLYEYKDVAEKSAVSAEFFLAERRYAPEKIHRVRQCIVTALSNLYPKPLEAQLLCDAITAYSLTENFDKRTPLLRLEWELAESRTQTDAEWEKYLYNQLYDAVFYLGYSKVQFEPLLTHQFLLQKQKIEKRQLELLAPPVLSKKEKKAAPAPTAEEGDFAQKRGIRSTIQTYYRSNYANHMHLSAIADNKAHIMISVNSILISVAISLLTYQTAVNKNPFLILPIVIFMVTSLTSLIFAVLSSRPRISSPLTKEISASNRNMAFFGNFVQLPMEQYEQAIEEMLRDGQLLLGNMTRDLYFLGKVLDKKYRLLTFSYNVFMLGFVVTVIGILAAYFM